MGAVSIYTSKEEKYIARCFVCNIPKVKNKETTGRLSSEKHIESTTAWNNNNPEKRNKAQIKYRKKNRDVLTMYQMLIQISNPPKDKIVELMYRQFKHLAKTKEDTKMQAFYDLFRYWSEKDLKDLV
jgi:hypothetical protein